LNKINKGMINKKLSCYMNAVLQSLLAVPHLFNMLIKISEEAQLEEECLLRDFVSLALYFCPSKQLERGSEYARALVPTEQIFFRILDVFNPERRNQDAQEFLSLCLDCLHEELKQLHFGGEGD